MEKDKREGENTCKYCGNIVFGITSCMCKERMENHKLWAKNPRRKKENVTK